MRGAVGRGQHHLQQERHPRRSGIPQRDQRRADLRGLEWYWRSGVRLGTAAISARGFQPADMEVVAQCIDELVSRGRAAVEPVRARVAALTRRYPLYKDC